MKKIGLRVEIPKWLKTHTEWPPIYNKGRIVFEESGHSLTNVSDYYICSQKQKGCCSNAEENNFKIKDLEEKIIAYTSGITLPAIEGQAIFFEIEKGCIDFEIETSPEIIRKRDFMAETIIAMEQDYKNTGKIKSGDIISIKETFKDLVDISYPLVMLFILKSVIDGITVFKYDNNHGYPERSFSHLVKHVYITNNGKISGVELDGLGDYLLQLIEKKKPGFIKNTKVKIINQKVFPSLNLINVIHSLLQDGYGSFISGSNFDSKFKRDKMFKDLFEIFNGASPIVAINACRVLKDIMWVNPLLYFVPNYLQQSDGRKKSEFGNIKINV